MVFFGTGTAVVQRIWLYWWSWFWVTWALFAIAAAFGFDNRCRRIHQSVTYLVCHVNPTVSIGVWLSGRMSAKDFDRLWCSSELSVLSFGYRFIELVVVNGSETLSGFGADGYGTLSAVGLSMAVHL